MKKINSIFLVDDDQDDQMIFLSVVRKIDDKIDCKCYDNGEKILEALQNDEVKKPDCIFLDLNMPLMTGFELLKKIKSYKELRNIPVVVYSTSSRDTDKMTAKGLGAFNFLSKSSTFDELKDNVTDILSEIEIYQSGN